jgi:UDP:flavonoid glycosyltransferase YjiC (YdhE family)
MWADLYDFATRAEYLGIGVRGNPTSAPRWTSWELVTAFQRVLGDGEEAKSIRSRAADLAEEHRKEPGKTRAAKAIADIVRL